MEITLDLLIDQFPNQEQSKLELMNSLCKISQLWTLGDILGFDSYEMAKDPAIFDCLVKLKEFVEENMETPPTGLFTFFIGICDIVGRSFLKT